MFFWLILTCRKGRFCRCLKANSPLSYLWSLCYFATLLLLMRYWMKYESCTFALFILKKTLTCLLHNVLTPNIVYTSQPVIKAWEAAELVQYRGLEALGRVECGAGVLHCTVSTSISTSTYGTGAWNIVLYLSLVTRWLTLMLTQDLLKKHWMN